MDMSSLDWLPEQDMQDQGFMNQYQIIKPYDHLVDHFGVDSFSSESNTENPPFVDQAFRTLSSTEEPAIFKRLTSYKKANNINNKVIPADQKPKPVSDFPGTFTISFGDLKPKDEVVPFIESFVYTTGMKKVPSMIRSPVQLQDHMLAERKRREKLAQRFIALSALLPGLKKMDKARVLEDAATYIQELQRRVKELEGLPGLKRKNKPTVISPKGSKLCCSDDDGSSSNEANFGNGLSPCNPDIRVRMSGSSVLVGIYCQKNYMSLVKALRKMQKLGLSVSSSSAMPFANCYLLIAIVAQKKDGFVMTSTDIVKKLQVAI